MGIFESERIRKDLMVICLGPINRHVVWTASREARRSSRNRLDEQQLKFVEADVRKKLAEVR